jgi:hypothetical protein
VLTEIIDQTFQPHRRRATWHHGRSGSEGNPVQSNPRIDYEINRPGGINCLVWKYSSARRLPAAPSHRRLDGTGRRRRGRASLPRRPRLYRPCLIPRRTGGGVAARVLCKIAASFHRGDTRDRVRPLHLPVSFSDELRGSSASARRLFFFVFTWNSKIKLRRNSLTK